MDKEKQTLPNGENEQKQNAKGKKTAIAQYNVPLITKLGLALIIAFLSCVSALSDGFFVGIFCAMVCAGVLAFTGVLTASGWHIFAILPALCLSLYPTLDVLALCLLAYLLIAALVMARTVYQRKSKTQATLYVSIALALSLVATVALYLFICYGTEALDVFKTTSQAVFDELKKGVLLVFEETKAALVAQGMYTEEYDRLFSEAYATELIRSFINILPASLCVTVMALSYALTSAFSILANKLHTKALLPKHYSITAKTPTAVLYIISTVISLFAPASSFAFLAAQNFTILLSPSFLIIGIREYVAQIRMNRRIPFSLVFYILALFISPMLPIYFLIFSGISATFAQRKSHRPKPQI